LNYGGEKQLFLVVPVSGVYFNHVKITACFAEININQMMRSLINSQSNKDVFFNLYYKNGENLVNSEFGNFKAGQNLLSLIKNNSEEPVAFAKTQWDFYEGNSDFIDVTYQNQTVHIYYTPVKSTGWMLTILVYNSAISNKVSSSVISLMRHSRLNIIVTIALIILLFIILILILRNNHKYVLEQEKMVTQKIQLAYEDLNKERHAMQILHSVLHSGPWSVEFDENKNIVKCTWSQIFRNILGFDSEEDFPDKVESWTERIHETEKDAVLKAFWDSVNDSTGKTIYDVEYRLLTNENGFKWYHAAGNLIRREDGSPKTFIGLFTDIDENKKNEQKLKEQFSIVNALSRDFATVLSINVATKIMTPIKLEGYIPRFYKKYSFHDAFYDNFFTDYVDERVYSEDRAFFSKATALETVMLKLAAIQEYASSYRVIDEGQIHFYEFKYFKLNDETIVVGFMNIDGIIRDAKEKEALIELSEKDRMTGLLNRVSGETKIQDCLKLGKGGLFILLDIDHFKFFNDTFGHGVGDQVIINVAKALKTSFREEDIVFRLGGDEFSAYAPDVHTKKTAGDIIARFIENLKAIVIPELGDNPITASIGATVIKPGKVSDFAEKYKLIDDAVYESKKNDCSYVTFK
jgi:diguanylate cyclase (GGDEF)-like protein